MIKWIYRFKNWIKESNRPNEYNLYEYLINDGKKHPFAIICPGGAYEMVCDHMEGKPVAEYLNKLGVNCFVLQYRRKQLFPAPIDDLTRAIKYCFENKEKLNLLDNYSIWGFSAGGHMAGFMGIHYFQYGLPKPSFLALAYPVNRFDEFANIKSKNNLLGPNPAKEMINYVTIDRNITKDFPKIYLWCGRNDHVVNPINSDFLEDKFKEFNVKYMYKKYPDTGHGIGLGEDTPANGWANEAVKFWLNN